MIGGICYDSWKLVCEYLTIYDEIKTLLPTSRSMLHIINEDKYKIAKSIGNTDPLNKSIRLGFIDGVMYWNRYLHKSMDITYSLFDSMTNNHLNVVKYIMNISPYNEAIADYVHFLLMAAIRSNNISNVEYIVSLGIDNSKIGLNWIIQQCIVSLVDIKYFTTLLDIFNPTDELIINCEYYSYLYCDMIYKYHDVLRERNILTKNNYRCLLDVSSCLHMGLLMLCFDNIGEIQSPSRHFNDALTNHRDFFALLNNNRIELCQWMIDNVPNFKGKFCYQLILDLKPSNGIIYKLAHMHNNLTIQYEKYFTFRDKLEEEKLYSIIEWFENYISNN